MKKQLKNLWKTLICFSQFRNSETEKNEKKSTQNLLKNLTLSLTVRPYKTSMNSPNSLKITKTHFKQNLKFLFSLSKFSKMTDFNLTLETTEARKLNSLITRVSLMTDLPCKKKKKNFL